MTAGGTQSFAFPFSPEPGLCTALSDEAFLAACLPVGGATRLAVKRAAKRSFQYTILPVNDDVKIGEALHKLLRSPVGRQNLAKELEHLGRLTILIHEHLLRLNPGVVPTEAEIFDEEQKEMPTDKTFDLKAWLKERKIENDILPLARFASAFALMSQEWGAEWSQVLIEKDSRFAEWFLPSQPPPQISQSPQPKKKQHQPRPHEPAKHPVKVEPLKAPAPTLETSIPATEATPLPTADTSSVPPVNGILTQIAALTSSVPLSECKALLNQIKDSAADVDEKLETLAVKRKSADEALTQVQEMRWFIEPPQTQSVQQVPESSSLDDCLRHLNEIETVLSDVLVQHRKLEALEEGLAARQEPFIQPQTPIVEADQLLSEKVATLEAQLERISSEASKLRALLDQLANADPKLALEIVEALPANCLHEIALLIARHSQLPAVSEILGELDGGLSLPSQLLARMWQRDEQFALSFLREAFPSDAPVFTEQVRNFFSYLELWQLQKAAMECRALAAPASELILCKALVSDHAEAIEWLEPLLRSATLDPGCAEFLRVMLDQERKGTLLGITEAVSALLTDQQPQSSHAATDNARRSVLSLINEQPGMLGYYHKLRVSVQLLYLRPLQRIAESGSSAALLNRWREFGDLDSMVDEAARACGILQDIETRHRQQTLRYLERFQSAVERWASLSNAATSRQSDSLARAFQLLRRHATGGSEPAAGMIEVLRTGGLAIGTDSDFGETVQGGFILPDTTAIASRIAPEMLCSWPLYLDHKDIPLVAFLTDTLRFHALAGKLDRKSAVSYYLQEQQFQAAREAAKGTKNLEQKVNSLVTQQREALERRFTEDLQLARKIRSSVPDVAVCLESIEQEFNDLDFRDAEEFLKLLAEFTDKFKLENDPQRKALVEYLQEADVSLDDRLSTDALHQRVHDFTSHNQSRRRHIQQLENEVLNEASPKFLVTAWTPLTTALDRPKFWPDADSSAKLAEALALIGRVVRGKSRSPDPQSPQIFLATCYVDWVSRQLSSGLNPGQTSQNALNILALAEHLNEFLADDEVLRFLQAKDPSFTKVAAPPSVVSLVPPKPATHVEKVALTKPEPEPALPLTLDALNAAIATIAPLPNADFPELRTAAALDDWDRVAALASTLRTNGNRPELKEDLEATLAVAILMRAKPEGEALPADFLADACLAILRSRRVTFYTEIKDPAEELLPNLLVTGLGEPGNEPIHARFASALARVAASPAQDPSYVWLSNLIRRANNATGPGGDSLAIRLANEVWKSFAKSQASARTRSFFLEFLFRIRNIAALKDLASSSPVAEQVFACLRAFEAAESNPATRPTALQLSAALRNQGKGKPNTQPWILLMHTLESARTESSTQPLEYEVVSNFVVENDDGSVELELRLRPSLFDPPDKLSITFTGYPEVALLEEPLFAERVIPVPLKPAPAFDASGTYRLSYQLSGMTLLRAPIDLRDSFEVRKIPHSNPLPEHTIKLAWPGATGEPVSQNHGFYGRRRETAKIESYLRSSPRMRSVMVFGERRIGKTSLLLQLVNSFPPLHGSPCGVFCDMQGVTFQGERTIAGRFFDTLLSQLDLDRDNGDLIEALRAKRPGNYRPDMKRLGKGLDPDASLSAALEGLAQKIEAESQGMVSRLVLVIDEFDRFVEPLLQNRREETDAFMWSLRQTIQRSDRIALVLAGSGLQQLLVQNYRDALFGSIEKIEIPRFRWDDPEDREAICDIVLPRVVRADVCPPDEVETVARHAHHICDGHPMFLAILSKAAANLAHGRFFTPAFFDWVAERIAKGDAEGATSHNRMMFYGSQFASLEVLAPKASALSKSMMATIAQYTSPEFPWLSNARLLELSGLQEFAEPRELLDCLTMLDTALAVEVDRSQARVRIRIPITAAVLREEAPAIIENQRSRIGKFGKG